MFSKSLTLLRFELIKAMRNKADIFNPLWFFLIVMVLFPLALGPIPALLERIAPGIVWVAALLSSTLALERLFRDDYIDGSLEQLLLSPLPLSVAVLVKVVAHWLVTGLPLILLSPCVMILFGIDSETFIAIALTLLLGTPLLSLIGAIGVALTVGLGKGGVLLSLLILPLYIPVLIFASSAVDAASMGIAYVGQLAIMAAMLVLALVLTPLATSAALRVSTS